MKMFLKYILLPLLFCVELSAHKLDEFKIMTETYPPYNLKEDGVLKGIGVELLALMLEKVGSKQTPKDFELLPWTEAYNIVQKEEKTLLFSMFRTEQREKLFKWVGPIDSSVIGIIARKDRKIRINRFSNLKNYKIGSVKDDVAELLLLEQGYNKNQLDSVSGVNSIEKSVQKLDSGEIDLFAYIANMEYWDLELKNFNPQAYESVYTLKRKDLYFALHKNTSDDIVNSLQNALDELKDDGTYDNILIWHGQ